MKIRITLLLTFIFLNMNPVLSHAQDDRGKNAALSTLGTQGSMLLYDTYVLIGAFHDGYVVDAWDQEMMLALLDEQSGLMVTLTESYDSLLISGYLVEEDRLYLLEMKECARLLKNEADWLIAYVNYESDENHQQYLDARNKAWEKITEILGINEHTGVGVAPRGGESGTK